MDQLPGGMNLPPETAQKMQQEAEQQAAQQEQKRSMMAAILTPEARNRLGNIQAVNPEKASKIEDVLVQHAQSGKLRSKIDEPQLKQMLADLSSEDSGSKVIFHGKPQEQHGEDSDSDSDDSEYDPDFGTRTKITIRM